jgi:hypothetical protein
MRVGLVELQSCENVVGVKKSMFSEKIGEEEIMELLWRDQGQVAKREKSMQWEGFQMNDELWQMEVGIGDY